MIRIHPRKLTGAWTEGFVLDFHTLAPVLWVATNMDARCSTRSAAHSGICSIG